MAIRRLPVHSDFPKYSFKAELDSTLYNFRFRYNIRSSIWIMDISDSSGNAIQTGVPIVTNVDLLSKFKDAKIPKGTLFAINPENQGEEATRDNFGTAVLLLYDEFI